MSAFPPFVVENHQLNHLPPTDLENLYHLASWEFSQHYTEKNSPVTLTVFLFKPLGNDTRTDRRTFWDYYLRYRFALHIVR